MENEKIIKILNAISDPTRLAILILLKEKELCPFDIKNALSIKANLLSHHLKSLKELCLISGRKNGLCIHYSINKSVFNESIQLLVSFLKNMSSTIEEKDKKNACCTCCDDKENEKSCCDNEKNKKDSCECKECDCCKDCDCENCDCCKDKECCEGEKCEKSCGCK